jgi:hypothetical protein
MSFITFYLPVCKFWHINTPVVLQCLYTHYSHMHYCMPQHFSIHAFEIQIKYTAFSLKEGKVFISSLSYLPAERTMYKQTKDSLWQLEHYKLSSKLKVWFHCKYHFLYEGVIITTCMTVSLCSHISVLSCLSSSFYSTLTINHLPESTFLHPLWSQHYVYPVSELRKSYVLSQPWATKSLVNLPHITGHFTDHFAWSQAVQCLLLFHPPRVRIHVFHSNVLQLILGFYSPHLMTVLESVSFSSQTSITHNKNIHYTLKFCWSVTQPGNLAPRMNNHNDCQ